MINQPTLTNVPITMEILFDVNLRATHAIVFFMLIGHLFTQDASLTYSIREEREPNTYVGSIALDSGLFANVTNEKFKQLQFQILREGNDKVNYFRIEQNTSLLWTNRIIDREGFPECYDECYIDFNVAVFDMDKLDFTQVIQIVIEIEDYNDNIPSFIPIESPILVPESTSKGTIIVSGVAIDRDQSLENSVQSYTLHPDIASFGVRTVEMDGSGKEFQLFLKADLNRESIASFDLLILAKDGGIPKKTGTLSLKILITDINDNPPLFSHSIYNASISENLPLYTIVISVHASDSDLGDYGKVSYRLSKRISDDVRKVFVVDASKGDLIVVGNIDYEVHDYFLFQVIAFDHGVPSQSSTAEIRIQVTDMNDNSPMVNLNLPPGGAIIAEDAAVGSFVSHVEIMDQDAGKNGQVVCNILDNHFRIESIRGVDDNYQILLNKSLDYDTKPEHNVTIFCRDNGELPRQTLVHFIVHVQDVNDNAPTFEMDVYRVDIDENNMIGVEITKVSATDLDSERSSNVSYSIHSDLFAINPLTGLITAVVSLDRETHGDQVSVLVYAEDNGNDPYTGTGTVAINIKDLNDNAPIFHSSPIRFNVTENMVTGTRVGNVPIYDPDNGLNGTFYFRFPQESSILEHFVFHESGLVTTNKQLDRETLAFHQFYIEAVDMGGLSSSVLVIVSVNDVNDNYPEITFPNEYDNAVSISYELAESHEVLYIEARDRDIGNNARLYYYIDQDNASYAFGLDVNTGTLSLNKTFHENNIGDTYHILLKVTDGGQPAFSTWSELNIKIIKASSLPILQEVTSQHNLWIVVGIVVFTATLSVTMILIMVKICWRGRRKYSSESIAENATHTTNTDKTCIDSSSGSSTVSNDTLEVVGNSDYMMHKAYQESFYGEVNGQDYVTNSTLDAGHKCMDHIIANKLNPEQPLDESISDISGEMGTRDSGQGGSDTDNVSLPDISQSRDHECTVNVDSSQIHQKHPHNNTCRHGRRQPHPLSSHNESSGEDLTSASCLETTCAASYSRSPAKTAQRKELSKLRIKGQKRVMFSDDLEYSYSNGQLGYLYTDTHFTSRRSNSPHTLDRGVGEHSTIVLNDPFNANTDWLRRSDNFQWRQGRDKIYDLMPSNHIKSSAVSHKTSNSKPMSRNIRTYLDNVMGRHRCGSLNDCPSDTLQSSDSNDVFMMSGSSTESWSRDGINTSSSGTYLLENPKFLTLNSDSSKV